MKNDTLSQKLATFVASLFLTVAASAQYTIDWHSIDAGGKSSGGDFAVSGSFGEAVTGQITGGDYVMDSGFDSDHGAIGGSNLIFDNTTGNSSGYEGASKNNWLAEKFCLRSQSYSLDSLSLLLISEDNNGEPRLRTVRLRIYSNDPIAGKPAIDTGVIMNLIEATNPITLPIGYTETPIEWRPATRFILAPNQCYWAVLSMEEGIVGEPVSATMPTGDAASFGRTVSLDAGITWNAPDNFTSRKMLIRGSVLSSEPPATVEALYVANSDYAIEKFTPEGVGSVFGDSAGNVPYGLAFDRAGNLYAASGDRILKFTPGGAQSLFAGSALHTPTGLAFDSAGNLYAANNGNNTIAKFTSQGMGSIFADTGLMAPAGLAFDRTGNLYAANGNNRIVKFTPEGVGTLFADTGLNRPIGLAFDSAGNLYAANSGSYNILKFTPDGVGSLFASSGLNAPWGLAFDGAGNLYAANSGDNTVQKFKPDGTRSVFADAGLHSPTFITFAFPAPMTVPLRITAVSISGDGLRISFLAISGRNYVVESLADLESDKWETFRDSTISSVNGTVQIDLPVRLDRSQQFYRVQMLP